MDPNELKKTGWHETNEKTAPIISRLVQTTKNNTSGQKKTNTGQEKICIENSAICRASKEIKTKHKRETCPEGHQNKTKKPFKKQN